MADSGAKGKFSCDELSNSIFFPLRQLPADASASRNQDALGEAAVSRRVWWSRDPRVNLVIGGIMQLQKRLASGGQAAGDQSQADRLVVAHEHVARPNARAAVHILLKPRRPLRLRPQNESRGARCCKRPRSRYPPPPARGWEHAPERIERQAQMPNAEDQVRPRATRPVRGEMGCLEGQRIRRVFTRVERWDEGDK